MIIKNDFGNTHHFTPAPFFISFHEYNIIFTNLKKDLKTGLDKITPQQFSLIEEEEYEITKRKIENKTYKFTRFKRIITENGRCVYIPSVRDRIVIEYLKQKLEKVFKPYYPNRENISNLIKSKLSFGQELYIFRYDIKSFFETIPQQKLLNKIKKMNCLSHQDYYLLVKCITSTSKRGLPVGISINNILSEIYLDEIDQEIKKVNIKISMYCRYVDDILIVLNGNLKEFEVKNIDCCIEKHFKKLGLRLNKNPDKKQIVHFCNNKNKSFNYLGYKYSMINGRLRINIADKKKSIILKKIEYIFNEYKLNNNIQLLIERLLYFTRINTMQKYVKQRSNSLRPILIKYGIIENYKNVDYEYWKEIDECILYRIHRDLKIEISDRHIRKRIFINNFQRNCKLRKINNFHKYKNIDFISKIISISPERKRRSLIRLNRNELELLYKEILCL